MKQENIDRNSEAMKQIYEFIEERSPLAGFVLLLFPNHNPHRSNWLCKATRQEMVDATSAAADRVQNDINLNQESPGTFYFEEKA